MFDRVEHCLTECTVRVLFISRYVQLVESLIVNGRQSDLLLLLGDQLLLLEALKNLHRTTCGLKTTHDNCRPRLARWNFRVALCLIGRYCVLLKF